MDGGNASLQDVCADELADGYNGLTVVRGREVGQDGANDASDDAAATRIAHAKSMSAEKHDGLEDFGRG
jgi:hypothetical protein